MSFNHEKTILTEEILNAKSSSFWQEKGYLVETTGDGSPTLRLYRENVKPDERPPESMHHSGGAASETRYIYGKSVEGALNAGLDLKVLVVGLGLGYIELISVFQAMEICEKVNQPMPQMQILSFEKDQFLTDSFLNFLNDKKLHPDLQSTYENVLDHSVPKAYQGKVKNFLLQAHASGSWITKGELNANFEGPKCNVIQYDAFSSKTDSLLWDEEFLIKFLQYFAEEKCVLSTYACLKNLKNALKREGFELQIRQGFLGKRDATLATRFQ